MASRLRRKHIKDYLLRALAGEPLQIVCADGRAAKSLREALTRLRHREANGHEIVVSIKLNLVEIRRISDSIVQVNQL